MRQPLKKLPNSLTLPALLLAGVLALPRAAGAQAAPAANVAQTVAAAVAPLGAGPEAGFEAQGTVDSYTSAGRRSGSLTLEVWGSQYCKLEVAFAGGVRYTVTVNGNRTVAKGQNKLVDAPASGGLAAACDLLPQGLSLADLATGAAGASDLGAVAGLAGGGPAHRFGLYRIPAAGASKGTAGLLAAASGLDVDLDVATGEPVRALYRVHQHAVETDYTGYQTAGGVLYPSQVEKLVDGSKRLTVSFTSVGH